LNIQEGHIQQLDIRALLFCDEFPLLDDFSVVPAKVANFYITKRVSWF